MNRNTIAVVFLVAVAGTATFLLTRPSEDQEIAATGTVEATDAVLGFERSGRLSEVLVREGDSVADGQVLAVLDTAELAAERSAVQAQLRAQELVLEEMEVGARPEEVARARAALTAAESRVVEANSNLTRARRLFEGGAISRSALDEATTRLNVVTADRDQANESLTLINQGPRTERIAAQRAIVEQTGAQLQRIEATLSRNYLEAPFGGVISVRHAEPGEVVGAGRPVLTVLQRDDRWVRIYVREDRIGAVRLGHSAVIRSDTYPDSTYAGEVVFISPSAEFTPRSIQTREERVKLVYAVKVRITADDSYHLKPGIPVDVELDLEVTET